MGVGREHVGAGVGVADDRDRRRVDLDPLEQVEVHPERVGEHGLDHVAVAHGQPDRVGARGPPSTAASRRRTASTARACICGSDSPPGNVAADGLVCTVFHSASRASSRELAPLPLAVVALGERLVGCGPAACADWRVATALAVSRQRSSGLLDQLGQRDDGQPLAGPVGLAPSDVVEVDARACGRPACRRRSRRCARAGAGSRSPWRRA